MFLRHPLLRGYITEHRLLYLLDSSHLLPPTTSFFIDLSKAVLFRSFFRSLLGGQRGRSPREGWFPSKPCKVTLGNPLSRDFDYVSSRCPPNLWGQVRT